MVISSVKTRPYLGVLLLEDLSFSVYIGKISQKASSKLGAGTNIPDWTSIKLEKIQCRAARSVNRRAARYRRADSDILTSRDLINIL